jgi:L-rhamnose mutarotase
VWPAILQSIKEAGIESLEIYRVENRLFMILEANEHFSFEKKKAMDDANETVQQWEELMWTYQQALPTAKPGQKWMLMEQIIKNQRYNASDLPTPGRRSASNKAGRHC